MVLYQCQGGLANTVRDDGGYVMYKKLLQEAKYAKASRSLTLMYQAYGATVMAEKLGAISREQFWTLNDMLVKDGINNPASYDKPIH